MGKVTLLFAGKSYDTDVQSVRENQIVIFDGPYNMRQRMVVAGIEHTQSGYNYRLIDPETAEEHSADLIRPLRDKFGIGHYYDDEHPEFMDAAEVAALRTRADALKAEQEAARRAAAEDAERLRIIGAERLRQIVPDDAMAVIIGEQHESECNPYTDYFGSRIVRTVILGFSTHTRDLFPEMRKAAARFEGTAHLTERNAEYEHREKYSMGHGYYLGTHRYSGWQVSKESCRDKEGIIKRFAVVAGNPDNVCIENPAPVQTAAPETVADARVEIVEYSAKSIAVFGDTKPLRDTLRDLNGLFRAYLTHDGTRCAGWISPNAENKRCAAHWPPISNNIQSGAGIRPPHNTRNHERTDNSYRRAPAGDQRQRKIHRLFRFQRPCTHFQHPDLFRQVVAGESPSFQPLVTKQRRTAMAELGQRACHVRRFDPLILNDFIMKSYEEIIQRTADFDYMMRTRLPEKYMPEVFGVTAGEDPDLRQLLHNASRNGIGITYLLFKIPYDRHKQLIKYLSK